MPRNAIGHCPQIRSALSEYASPTGCLFARFTLRKLASLLLLLSCAACVFFMPMRHALSDGCTLTPVVVRPEAQSAAGEQGSLSIDGWQGAKNYQQSFPITVSGGYAGGKLRFLTNNCQVSPSSGTTADSYTVTITGAGNYSMTVVMSGDATHGEISESRNGVAGKADQEPLTITGWGNARNYYRTFSIQVVGGTTKGTVRFQADGCAVSPTTGNINSVFTVTVTRVGSYSLTALMDGNSNYLDACSAKYTGMSGKSEQASIMIQGWISESHYGDTFPLVIAGGSTSEALTITANGCEVVKDSGHNYTVSVNSVGPYSVTATRGGNYGYHTESSSVCGVSTRASQSSLSISGWADAKNVADAFGIRVSGGMSGGMVRFATTGCTIKPETGTTDTDFIVTVDTAGEYTLVAFIDSDENHYAASSRTLKGTAGKAIQPALAIDGWNESAASGSSFDVTVLGGNGSGAMSVSTNAGCTAIRKNGENAVYTVTVTAGNGEEYAMSVSKSGDASYCSAAQKTVSGTASKSAQSALTVNGWKDASEKGYEFAIQIAGGNGNGKITFETVGCEVIPESGDIDDVYQVIVTAEEGQPYSLSVKRAGDGIYANASVLRSGSVRHSALNATITGEALPEETETPLLGDGFDVFLLIGMLSILLVLVAIAIVLQQQQKQRRRRYRYARR